MKIREKLSLKLSNNTLMMSIGLGIRMIIQALLFILAARFLRVEQFGLFSAIQALVTLSFPLANWGSGYILIKHVSRGTRPFDLMWSTSLYVTLILSTVLIVFLSIVTCWMYSFEISIRVTLPIALGDLLGLALVTISSQAFQSREFFLQTSSVWVILSLARLSSIGLLFGLPVEINIENWAIFYGLGGLLGGIISICWVISKFGLKRLSMNGMENEWQQGLYFSVSVSAQGVYNNIDKTLLSQLVSNNVAGLYSVAYKVVDFFTVPIQSLTFVLFPEFFKNGKIGPANVYRSMVKISPWSLTLGIFSLITMVLFSTMFSSVFGNEFQQSSLVALFLSPLIIFRSFHYLAANALAGSDYQNIRSWFQIGIAILNLLLNLLLIPIYGIWGAIITSLVSDFLLALGMLLFMVGINNSWRLFKGTLRGNY